MITALPAILHRQLAYHAGYKQELKAIFIQTIFVMLTVQQEPIKNHLIIHAKIVMTHVMDAWIPQLAACIVLHLILG